VGGPRSIALGLFAGALAMALADREPRARPAGDGRALSDAGARDGLALGLAQAVALIPGISRNGATLTTARLRGFDRGASRELSWIVALPVIAGASALKGYRLAQRGVPRSLLAPLAVGAGASFLSTRASLAVARPRRRGGPLLPYSLYRGALALLAAHRLREPSAT
jgi:undecaprenyl-diphosphatase